VLAVERSGVASAECGGVCNGLGARTDDHVTRHGDVKNEVGMYGDVVDVLRQALTWELPAPDWVNVGAAIGRLEASHDVRADVGHLELAGAMRIITRYGDRPVTQMPEELRERVNELIHALGAVPDAEDADGTG
jgi:hypothetical protein